VGVFSRLSYWKGQHVLLEAMRELPGVHALLAGEALFGETEYIAQLKALVSLPELAGRIHWLGFRSDVPALMATCNIVVHTSTEPEPFGRIVEGQQRTTSCCYGWRCCRADSGWRNWSLGATRDAVALARTLRELWQTHWQWRLWRRGCTHARATFPLKPAGALTAL